MAIDMSSLAFPRPKDIKREPEPVHTYPSGRQVCNLLTAAGRAEYGRRLTVAWTQQKGICPWCHLYVTLELASVDHVEPRGMGGGRRDDRQENIAAVHLWCNQEKGSRRIAYNPTQSRPEASGASDASRVV